LRPAQLCIPLLLAVAISGCGQTRIDSAKAERLIGNLVAKQIGARVVTVRCPTGIVARKGVKFTCQVAAADSTKGDVVVTGRDGHGSVDVTAPFLLVRRSEADMARMIDEQFDDSVKVSCPEIIVIRKGATFHCTSQSGDVSSQVSGRFLDDRGRYTFAPD
jgi:hypothetical protein